MAKIDLSDLEMAFEATGLNGIGASGDSVKSTESSAAVKQEVVKVAYRSKKGDYQSPSVRAEPKRAQDIHTSSVPSEPRTHAVAVDTDFVPEPKMPEPVPILNKSIDGVLPDSGRVADDSIGELEAAFLADGQTDSVDIQEPTDEIQDLDLDEQADESAAMEQVVEEVDERQEDSEVDQDEPDPIPAAIDEGSEPEESFIVLSPESGGRSRQISKTAGLTEPSDIASTENLEDVQDNWLNKDFSHEPSGRDIPQEPIKITKVDVTGNAIPEEGLETDLNEKTELPLAGKTTSRRLRFIWILLIIQALLLIVFIAALLNGAVFDFLNDIIKSAVDLV